MDITSNLKLLDPHLSIPGYDKFIGSYLVLGAKNAIVDPGPTSAKSGLLSALAKAGVRPEDIHYVVLTHIHIDHAGGTGDVIKYLPNATVISHRRAIPHLVDPAILWSASRKTLGDLAYLEEMNKDEYARELVLLNNSINGMAGCVPRVKGYSPG